MEEGDLGQASRADFASARVALEDAPSAAYDGDSPVVKPNESVKEAKHAHMEKMDHRGRVRRRGVDPVGGRFHGRPGSNAGSGSRPPSRN